MKCAPIILFVFNRPGHTRETLRSLANSRLAAESELFIFSDGPRSEKDVVDVEAVRTIARNTMGFKTIKLFVSDANRGLADSVIQGVSKILAIYGAAIVIEDDLIFSPYFLDYMNSSLNKYRFDSRVFSIGGYSPPISIPPSYGNEFYLSYRCCTWGWATWLDRWERVDWEIVDYDDFRKNPYAISRFNRGGDDMSQILHLQMSGKIDSWGIRWDYAHYKNEAYCLRPNHSIVGNTGNDGSGIHCGATNKFDVKINESEALTLPDPTDLTLNIEINQRFAEFYDGRKRNGCDTLGSPSLIPSLFLTRLRRFRQFLLGR